jgi:hypothetical protein
MEDGQVTVLVLLDFSQAFDMVIYGLLLCKLKNLQNYTDGARMLVDSYLNGSTQFVRCGEKESWEGDVWCSAGVSRFVTVLVFRIYKGQRCYDEINMHLHQIHERATANGLKLNPEKRQVILIHRCRADIPPPTLLIGANVIKVVPRVRNLGVVLNERLTATDHFWKVCQKNYWILRF